MSTIWNPLYDTKTKLLQADASTTKVLQFTDIHFHMEYKEGTNAGCGLPICCRVEDGIPRNATDIAGMYGHYSCALAPTALDAMFSHANETHSVQSLNPEPLIRRFCLQVCSLI
jgi:hypothetical protein